jgi:manganese/zinc/iron transport system permease protein
MEPDLQTLLDLRSWSPGQLRRTLDRLKSQGLVSGENGRFRLTKAGRREAASVVRKHRLWEAYLIAHADVAPGHVDWGADQIEHVLDAEMIRQLERRIPELIGMAVPRNPHAEPRLEN